MSWSLRKTGQAGDAIGELPPERGVLKVMAVNEWVTNGKC